MKSNVKLCCNFLIDWTVVGWLDDAVWLNNPGWHYKLFPSVAGGQPWEVKWSKQVIFWDIKNHTITLSIHFSCVALLLSDEHFPKTGCAGAGALCFKRKKLWWEKSAIMQHKNAESRYASLPKYCSRYLNLMLNSVTFMTKKIKLFLNF